MARILIAAEDVVTAQGIQGVLENRGHQTANVWAAMDVVEFCGKHVPDLIVMDMHLSEGRSWSAVQIMRQDSRLAGIPIFGLSRELTDLEIEHAKALDLIGLEQMPSSAEELSPSVDRAISLATKSSGHNLQAVPGSQDPADSKPVAAKLKDLTCEIRELATALSPFTRDFGDDGPELFNFIDTSTDEILAKLDGYIEQGLEHASMLLQDREVRHDFRNMIGSVTGFSELILMEPGLDEDMRQKFTRIRQNSATFVALLDEQKQVAQAA